MLQTLCDVERRLHPEMWCIFSSVSRCLKWPAQLLELQGLVTVESLRLSILSEILIIVKLFVAAEVNEFVVYLVGFIDWVLVHTEKLITSFSILYLVRRIPKYQSSSELLLIWMAMGQTFLNRICKSPERERRSVSGICMVDGWAFFVQQSINWYLALSHDTKHLEAKKRPNLQVKSNIHQPRSYRRIGASLR